MSKLTLVEKGVKFISASTRFVMSGFQEVPENVQQERLSICKECPFFSGGENPECEKCGCLLNLKTKWATEKCPIDKWLEYSIESRPHLPCGQCNKHILDHIS
jgi:hypothetical protein